ncbi:hypothetical protein [Planococcus sp. YIM B11945]|uniref:hypothetical protein n=1 Tax=Planococcus sp. YIM B11945 TaxID=3435410 RepID=UPI003D7CE98A
MEKDLSFLEKLNWNQMKRSGGKIFIVDLNESLISPKDITEEFERKELETVNSIVLNTSHEMNTFCTGTYYEIKERILDNHDNLILIAQSHTINFQRK